MDRWTSDLHIEHQKIIELSHRPFKDLAEMHEVIVQNWNAVVEPGDVTYVLGDMALGKIENLEPVISRLNGTIVLVKGNHDKSPRRLMEACPSLKMIFNNLHMTKYIGDKGYRVFMRHFPPSDPDTWQEKYGANVFLCGHVHEAWSRRGNVINVGVDVRGFRPQTFEQLIQTPARPEKPRPDQCYTCGMSLTIDLPGGMRGLKECAKHPTPEM